jgi:hypothetical protein
MIERLTLAIVAAACLLANALPGAVVKEVIPITVTKEVKPLLQLGCDKKMRGEITEACRVRARSI